jgi:UDP-glucuronate 4-epimerase
MAYAYSSLYGIPATGLRFFTVYGPFGRPDMAYYSFSEKIIQGKRINVFNSGNMKRDFTFIDDVTESIKRLINHPPKVSNINQKYLYNIFNIGNSKPVELNYFISLLEKYLKKEAKKSDKPMQKGDMIITYSDTTELKKYINFEPKVNIEDGLKIFCDWLLNFNN